MEVYERSTIELKGNTSLTYMRIMGIKPPPKIYNRIESPRRNDNAATRNIIAKIYNRIERQSLKVVENVEHTTLERSTIELKDIDDQLVGNASGTGDKDLQ